MVNLFISSLVMIRYREIETFKFAEIFRIFISGSSSAGKTYFAKNLLKTNIFKYERVYYFHPDFHEHAPVDWHNDLDKPVLYQPGVPSLRDLLEIPQYSVLVFDDLFSQCCQSNDIDYLFRVLSSKRKLNVIIMTQRYFAGNDKGRCGLSIRNSSNYHVLMRNADARTNQSVAAAMQLKPEITKAIEENKGKLYPYIFIDRTNEARVNGLQIFINILSKRFEVIINRMKYFLISEADFNSSFTVSGENLANANKTSSVQNKRKIDKSSKSSSEVSSSESNSESSDSDKSNESRFRKRKRREQEIAKALRRHRKRSKLLGKNQ